MRVRTFFLLCSLLSVPVAAGCAGSSGSESHGSSSGAAVESGTHGGSTTLPGSPSAASTTTTPATTAFSDADRTAILALLHDRTAKDFAGVPSLAGYALVLSTAELESDGTKAFFRGDLKKQDPDGQTADLTTDDYAGTIYATLQDDGLFDSAHVEAGLEKVDGAWRLLTTPADPATGAEASEAYELGTPGDAWKAWGATYGIPPALLGADSGT